MLGKAWGGSGMWIRGNDSYLCGIRHVEKFRPVMIFVLFSPADEFSNGVTMALVRSLSRV